VACKRGGWLERERRDPASEQAATVPRGIGSSLNMRTVSVIDPAVDRSIIAISREERFAANPQPLTRRMP
jgi:hypothetical protein